MSILDRYPTLKHQLEIGTNIYVAFCTPMYGGVGLVDYFGSLINTMNLLDSVGIKHKYFFTKQESLIQRARNTLVGLALNIPEITHIFFVDGDIQWNSTDVLGLLNNDVDLVGGIYPKKSYNFKGMVKADEILKGKATNKYSVDIPDDAYLKHHLVSYNLNTCGSNTITNGLVEVQHIATGFMMIKRGVFEKMIIAHPEWEYLDNIHTPPLVDIKFYAFFECLIKDKYYLSEDWTFCERWKELGGKVYANVCIPLTHIGTVGYEGRLLSTLNVT